MRLHESDSYVTILIPETADLSVGSAILGKAQDTQSPPQEAHCREAIFFPAVVGNLNTSKGASGISSKAHTSSVLDQHSICLGGQHTLAS